MKIKGSRFVITGANRGIGLAVAKMAASNGAHLYLTCRDANSLSSEEFLNHGASSVTILAGDLSSREGVEQISKKNSRYSAGDSI